MANVEQDIVNQRLPLAAPLGSRNGTITKDALITNGFVEASPDGKGGRIYKRPGMTQLFNLGLGGGKGMTSYVDTAGVERLLAVAGNTLSIPSAYNISASSPTWAYKAGPVSGTRGCFFVDNDVLYCVSCNAADGAATANNLYKKASPSTTSWTLVASNVFSSPATHQTMMTHIKFQGAHFISVNDDNGEVHVWRSYNLLAWTRLSAPPWNPDGPGGDLTFAYGNYLWHIASNGTDLNKVWRSSDGDTWALQTSTPTFTPGGGVPLQGMAVISANNKMWLVGGFYSSTPNLKVYSSTDGITWTTEATDWGIGTRTFPLFYQLSSGQFVIQSGRNIDGTVLYEDIWTSNDCLTWTQTQTTTVGTAPYGSTGASTKFWNHASQFTNGTVVVSTMFSATDYPYIYGSPSATSSITVNSSVSVADSGMLDFATDYLKTQIMVRSDNVSYKFTIADQTFTQITDVDFPTSTVRGCVYLDGTFYVMNSEGTIYGSDLDNCTSWNATNFIAAEFEPDGGVFLGKKDAYVVALGTYTTQFFWDVGNATASPLAPVQNGAFNVGCAHGNSAQQLEATIIWVAQSKAAGTSHQQGRFVALLTDLGYKKISTADVDRVINADNFSTVYSCTSNDNGHTFYHLILGTTGITLTYDLTSEMWYTWTRSTAAAAVSVSALTQSNGIATATATSHGFADGDEVVIAGATPSGYNGTFNITYVNANSFTYPVSSSLSSTVTGTITATGSTESYFDMVASCSYDGHTVFQDQADGIIWQMDEANTQDNSVSINFKVRTPVYSMGNNKNKFCSQAVYVGLVNSSADVGLLRYTDDDYATYSNYRQVDLTSDFANLNALGKFRRRAWEWRHTRAQKHYIDTIEVDYKQGIA